MKIALRNALSSSIGATAFALVNTVLVTRALSTDDRGVFTLVQSTIILCVATCGLSLPRYFLHQKYLGLELPSSGLVCTVAAVFVGAPIAALFWFATFAYNDAVALEFGAAALIVIFHVSFFLHTQFNQLLLGESELKANARYRILYPLLVSVFLIMVWAAYRAGGEATVPLDIVIAVYFLGTAWCAVLQQRQIRTMSFEPFSAHRFTQCFQAFRPRFVWFGEMLIAVNRNVDKVILSFLVSTTDLALYGIGFALSRALNGVQNSVANAFYANSYTDHAARTRRMLLGLAIIAAIGAGALLVFLIAGAPLLRLLFGEAYVASAVLCSLLAIEATFSSMGRLVSEVLISTSNTHLFFYRQLVLLGITVPAVWFAAASFGPVGAATAVVGTSAIGLLLALGMSRSAATAQTRVPN